VSRSRMRNGHWFGKVEGGICGDGQNFAELYCARWCDSTHGAAECDARDGRLSKEAGLRVANVFHAGDGNLHPLVCMIGEFRDTRTWRKRFRAGFWSYA